MNSMSARAVKDLDGNISQSCSVKNSLGIFGLGVGYLLFCTVLATWRPLLHQIDFLLSKWRQFSKVWVQNKHVNFYQGRDLSKQVVRQVSAFVNITSTRFNR